MGVLINNIGLRMLVDGNGLAENFKNNSIYFYKKYQQSDNIVEAVNISDIKSGRFYHFLYLDDSNWMRLSPVFVIDYKKVFNKIIIRALNFNFIPLEERALLFDKFFTDKIIKEDLEIKADYKGVYDNLLKIGFEYALVEYDASLIKIVHRISMQAVPRFLISQDPSNKYDPKKLYQIMMAKQPNREQRNNEIQKLNMKDLYDVEKELDEDYIELKNHINRIQANQRKYGHLY